MTHKQPRPNELRPELKKIVESSLVKDLGHKLSEDLSKKSAEVCSLADSDIERAMIIMYGVVALQAIAGTLIIKQYPQIEPEQAWAALKRMAAIHDNGALDVLHKKREDFDGGESGMPEELKRMLGSIIGGMSRADLFGHTAGDTSIKRRNRALKQVEDNANEWMGLALLYLRTSIRTDPTEEFTVEDIKRWVIGICGKPHHHNAVGALIRKAMIDKIIVDTGKVTRSVALKSHARKISIYRWG